MAGIITGVSGVNREVKKVTAGVAGVNREIKSAWAGNGGVNRKVFAAERPIGSLLVGSIVKLNENGVPVHYLVVHQGLPSSLYDVSCDGAWLLRKDIFESHQWHDSNYNSYSTSDIKAYHDSTYWNVFAPNIKNAIKQVKIPYRPGSGTSMSVNSGANGLSCKIFLLSGYEMGWTSEDNRYFPPDGAKLVYFEASTSTSANNKRIAYFNGSATSWWLRSPVTHGTGSSWMVTVGGLCGSYGISLSFGVRPALILPSNSLVSNEPDTTGAYILQF